MLFFYRNSWAVEQQSLEAYSEQSFAMVEVDQMLLEDSVATPNYRGAQGSLLYIKRSLSGLEFFLNVAGLPPNKDFWFILYPVKTGKIIPIDKPDAVPEQPTNGDIFNPVPVIKFSTNGDGIAKFVTKPFPIRWHGIYDPLGCPINDNYSYGGIVMGLPLPDIKEPPAIAGNPALFDTDPAGYIASRQFAFANIVYLCFPRNIGFARLPTKDEMKKLPEPGTVAFPKPGSITGQFEPKPVPPPLQLDRPWCYYGLPK